MSQAMDVFRGAAAAALGAALVLLGVVSGAPDVPEAEAALRPPLWAEGEMPEVPGALEYPLGDGMAVNGVPIRMSYLQAKIGADALLDHYRRALDARGLAPNVAPGLGGGWTVTAMAADGRAQIVVAILGQGPNRSLVFPAIVPFNAASDAARQHLVDLPLSPAATAAWTVTSNDRPGESVVTYQEPEQPAAEAAAFIRDELGRRGWDLLEFRAGEGARGGWIVEGRREGRRARFSVAGWPKVQAGATVTVESSKGD